MASRRTRRRPDDDAIEEEETPTRSRRRPRPEPEEDDEPPRRSRSRRRDEDEVDEEETPRRSRSRRRDEDEYDEEEPPRRSRSRRDEDEDDEDEAPRRSRSREGAPKASDATIRDGWSGSQQVFDSTSSYAQAFKLEEQSKVVCFLEDRPYAGFARHWIERVQTDDSGKRRKVNRPYTCLTSVGLGECPVCEAGDKPQAVSSFNIAEVGDDGVPTLKTWDVGAKLYKILKGYNGDRKVGPLNREGLYFLASRSGSGGTTNYQVNPVSEDGLERVEVLPPTDAQLDALLDQCYDKDIIQIPTRKEMRELAAELSDYDEYEA